MEGQLLAALSHPPSRGAAAWALSRIGKLRSTSAADLLKLLSSDDLKVGSKLPVLGLTPDQPIAALVANALENAPAELAGEVVPRLIGCVRVEENRPPRNSHTRYAAAKAAFHLAQSSQAVIPDSDETALRGFLLEVQRAVENGGTSRTRAVRFLRSSGGKARRWAQNPVELVTALRKALQEQPAKGQPGETAEIMYALAAFDPDVVGKEFQVPDHQGDIFRPVFRPALMLGSSVERGAALDAVVSAKAKVPFVIESLVHCLGDADWQIRVRAVATLRKLDPDWHGTWVRTQPPGRH